MKTFLQIILLCISISGYSQVPLADELITIHTVTDNAAMNNIASPNTGSVVFNDADKHIYQFDGNLWRKMVFEKEIIQEITGNYTLGLKDNGCALIFKSVSDVVLMVPLNLPIGFNVSIYQVGNGTVTVDGTGASVKNRLSRFTTAGLDAAAGLICTSKDIFHLSGDLKR